jgi:hypothetical protein
VSPDQSPIDIPARIGRLNDGLARLRTLRAEGVEVFNRTRLAAAQATKSLADAMLVLDECTRNEDNALDLMGKMDASVRECSEAIAALETLQVMKGGSQ